ncbi:putative membrane protein [Arthrobacter tumbae]|nr:putative membrane protein [Arthrobacter tumbae]
MALAIFYFVLAFVTWLPISLVQGALALVVLRLVRVSTLRLVLVFVITLGISSLVLLIGLSELGLKPSMVLSWAAVVAPLNAVSWTYAAGKYLKVSI